eukprot:TRINITY_DN3394_c0_g1_i1.p1 TRINITY_DN3394_c0_g1~~TRINITY_DN3394_c0_g1_i1.p1  ORF type:complete len:775 (-),score=152.04 TRINITY_DN3394_c0_g1_i1:402-2726(-)
MGLELVGSGSSSSGYPLPCNETRSEAVTSCCIDNETVWAYWVFSCLSLLGSGIIIVSYIFIRQLRRFPYNLVFFLSLSDFFFTLRYILLLENADPSGDRCSAITPKICLLQALWSQFFGLASISWNGVVSINLVLDLQNPFGNNSSYFKWYHLFVWSLSAGTTLVMFIGFKSATCPEVGDCTNWMMDISWLYSINDHTCWFNDDSWYQALFMIPLVFYIFVAAIALILTLRHAWSGHFDRFQRRAITVRMFIFTLLFVSLWSVYIANKGLLFLKGENEVKQKLSHIAAACIAGEGFVNAIIWLSHPFFNKSLRENRSCQWFFFTILFPCLYCASRGKKYVGLMYNTVRGNNGDDDDENASKENISLRHKMAEQIPLLKELRDAKADPQMITFYLRKNMILNLLRGIAKSIEDQKSIADLTIVGSSPLFDDIKESNQPLRAFLHSDEHQMASSNMLNHAGNSNINNGPSFKFVDYAPSIFSRLRALSGISKQSYLESLDINMFANSLTNEKFSEGRSGSFFCFSPDKKFVIKTIAESECLLLRRTLKKYYNYLCNNPNSLLIRCYGCHAVKYEHVKTVYIVVMGNIFNTTNKVHERYDIKGSWVRRCVGKDKLEKDPSLLRLDLDLEQDIMLGSLRETFVNQIRADVQLLQSLQIIDYSLLIGIHYLNQRTEEQSTVLEVNGKEFSEMKLVNIQTSDQPEYKTLWQSHQGGILSSDGKMIYYFGIIDMLQLFDCQKRSERCCKVWFLRKDPKGVSVQAPEDYATRFVRFLENKIL